MLRPVVLAGGAGTRLWPLSREHFPKQFLSLVGGDTMLQQAVQRLREADPGNFDFVDPLIVCNEEHRFLVLEQLAAVEVKPAALILEPVGRSTAPALTLAALWSEEIGGDAVLAAMPADHHMTDLAAFGSAMEEGYALALEGWMVTFGIPPTGPETGYGYIQVSDRNIGSIEGGKARVIEAFAEKPGEDLAREYLATGQYLWNCGIFLMRARVWLQLVERFRPDIAATCRAAHSAGQVDGHFFRPGAEEFRACPSDSIDYAVAERLPGGDGPTGAVVPMDAGWSDVGTWSAVRERMAPDQSGNTVRGDVLTHDVEESTLIAENRLLAGVGLRNLIVVETSDAVLVAGRDRDQDVRDLVTVLRKGERDERLDLRRVHRPWGTYEVIERGTGFQVKHLTVKPGASLSLQRHRHRSEHWVVVRGEAAAVIGEVTHRLSENESMYVPKGAIHRLSNPGEIPLEIVEVQTGDYLGEDDIERLEDNYSRA